MCGVFIFVLLVVGVIIWGKVEGIRFFVLGWVVLYSKDLFFILCDI